MKIPVHASRARHARAIVLPSGRILIPTPHSPLPFPLPVPSASASVGLFYFSPVFRAVCENILHTSHSGLVGLLRVRLHCFKLKLLCCRCSMHASHCRIPVPAPGPAPFSVPVPSAEASYFPHFVC